MRTSSIILIRGTGHIDPWFDSEALLTRVQVLVKTGFQGYTVSSLLAVAKHTVGLWIWLGVRALNLNPTVNPNP